MADLVIAITSCDYDDGAGNAGQISSGDVLRLSNQVVTAHASLFQPYVLTLAADPGLPPAT